MNFILIAYLIGKFVKTFFFLSETLGNEAIHTCYTCSLSNLSIYIKNVEVSNDQELVPSDYNAHPRTSRVKKIQNDSKVLEPDSTYPGSRCCGPR